MGWRGGWCLLWIIVGWRIAGFCSILVSRGTKWIHNAADGSKPLHHRREYHQLIAIPSSMESFTFPPRRRSSLSYIQPFAKSNHGIKTKYTPPVQEIDSCSWDIDVLEKASSVVSQGHGKARKNPVAYIASRDSSACLSAEQFLTRKSPI